VRVLLDANVLYGQFSRYLLLSLATRRVLEPRWSEAILNETVEALRVNGVPAASVGAQVHLLRRDWPGSFVDTSATPLPASFTLPDPDDVHVVRAAVAARAPVILTFNLADFPDTALAPLGIRAEAPGTWCRARWEEAEAVGSTADFLEALRGHRATLRKPAPWTPDEYRGALQRYGFADLASVVAAGAL